MSEGWTVDTLLEGSAYSSSCTLIRCRTQRVLIDTGLSLQERHLVRALRARGLDPADIDLVINTHLHVDHCGNNAVFPRALIFMSREEWCWMSSFYAALFASRTPEHVVADFYPEAGSYRLPTRIIRNVTGMARRLWNPARLGTDSHLRWLETHALPDGLEPIATPGHTPHHVSVRVAADSPAVIAGDAVLAADIEARVHTMIPHSRAQALASREALISRGEPIVPGHGAMFWPRVPIPAPTD